MTNICLENYKFYFLSVKLLKKKNVQTIDNIDIQLTFFGLRKFKNKKSPQIKIVFVFNAKLS